MSARRQPSWAVPGGAGIFQRVYTRLGCQSRPPQFVVEFYPYASLVHTVRLREDTAQVRLSDVLQGAPLEIVEAAAVDVDTFLLC